MIDCLKRPCSFDFSDATLEDIAATIEEQFEVHVFVEQHALAEIGLEDPKITFETEGISLRAALLLMLEPFDLTFSVRLESIVLTTYDAAHDNCRAVVYDVTDLLVPVNTSTNSRAKDDSYAECVDFNSLIILIELSVRPSTWSTHGSDCGQMLVKDKRLLVIRQSEYGHLEIENLLASIRRKIGVRGEANAGASSPPNPRS
ncbi:MAG: hypothetical protein AAF802_17045 [Planctomycetota bacterium]